MNTSVWHTVELPLSVPSSIPSNWYLHSYDISPVVSTFSITPYTLSLRQAGSIDDTTVQHDRAQEIGSPVRYDDGWRLADPDVVREYCFTGSVSVYFYNMI